MYVNLIILIIVVMMSLKYHDNCAGYLHCCDTFIIYLTLQTWLILKGFHGAPGVKEV